jgi:phosphoglycerol transferase MdoB-like AlkP superfamily enzyme
MHTPYPRLPKELEKYPPDPNTENGFYNTLNYTDWSIGEFIKKARMQDWFDNTIFVFTADHALAHYQTGGILGKFRTPLIVYAPRIIHPQVITNVGSQLDLFKTIIELLDLEATYSAFGNSILASDKDSFALVRDGSIMGIIAQKGYLQHSLRNRLETGSFDKQVDDSYFDGLEKKLLASDQLVFEFLQSNRWSE